MKRFLCVFLLSLICMSSTVFAATPLMTYIEIKNERHVVIRTFETSPEEDPALLKENPFELDGFSYTYYNTEKEEIPFVEKKQETRQETIETQDNDMSGTLQQLALEVNYDEDGFVGKLLLDNDSIKTEVKGYETKTYTIKDTFILPTHCSQFSTWI